MPDTQWNSALYDQKHSFVFSYGKDLLSLLNAQPGERILDLGCGTGHLAQTISETGAEVIGIDGSPDMIASAQASYPGLHFEVADARTFSFAELFDAVFSNATLHWIPEAEQVIIQIAQSLKPGGRFVAEFGGKGNVEHITTALQQAVQEIAHVQIENDWYFPSIGDYTPLLEKHGLMVSLALLFDRPTELADGEKGLRNWITMFAARMLDKVPSDLHEQIFSRVEEQLRPQLFRDGRWYADYRRIRIVAQKV